MLLDTVPGIEAFEASLMRTLASPHRLRIVHLLGARPREVNELSLELGLPQAAVSAHLAAMRHAGVVEAARMGRSVRYRLSDPEIMAACDLMREVLRRRLAAIALIAGALGEEAAPADPAATIGPPSHVGRL